MKTLNIKRGDIYYADLSPVVGSEQGGVRPVLIVQNNVGNRFSPTVIAAAITSRQSKAKLPTHIPLYSGASGLSKDSVVLLEKVRTIDASGADVVCGADIACLMNIKGALTRMRREGKVSRDIRVMHIAEILNS